MATLLLGLCVRVHDGDTISVSHNQRLVRVRVVSIDSPEMGQPYGRAAKRFMNDLCYNKNVRLVPLEKDRFGRLVAKVYLEDGRDVGQEMVKNGMAWYDRRYHPDTRLERLEEKARAGRQGLWREPSPIPPWQWRRQHPRESNPNR